MSVDEEEPISPPKPPVLPRVLFWCGVVLCTGPVLGFGGAIFNMQRAFEEASAGGSPEQLAASVSGSQILLFSGVGAFVLGVPLLVAGILLRRRRPRRRV